MKIVMRGVRRFVRLACEQVDALAAMDGGPRGSSARGVDSAAASQRYECGRSLDRPGRLWLAIDTLPRNTAMSSMR